MGAALREARACPRLPSTFVSASLPSQTHAKTGHIMTLPASFFCLQVRGRLRLCTKEFGPERARVLGEGRGGEAPEVGPPLSGDTAHDQPG